MSEIDSIIVFDKKENFDIKLKHIVNEGFIFQISRKLTVNFSRH